MLNGQTILVVEAEFLIALDIQRMLEGLGAGQMLFARAADEVQELESRWQTIGLAIVEIGPNSSGETTLVRSLLADNIPVICSTADSALRQGHPDFPGVPVVIKPISDHDLAATIAAALTGRN
jgi:two-component system, response regulator PdtaR